MCETTYTWVKAHLPALRTLRHHCPASLYPSCRLRLARLRVSPGYVLVLIGQVSLVDVRARLVSTPAWTVSMNVSCKVSPPKV